MMLKKQKKHQFQDRPLVLVLVLVLLVAIYDHVSRPRLRLASSTESVCVMTTNESVSPPASGAFCSTEEKKANHIQSEQKRRQVIRDAFDELTSIVPGLGRAQSKSEAIVLKRTVEYIKEQRQEQNHLENELALLKQQQQQPHQGIR